MVITPRMTEAIENGLPHTKLREVALEEGMHDLVHSGLQLVLDGRTTLEEVYYKTSS